MQPPQSGPPPPPPSMPQSASFPLANANEIADYDRYQQQRYVQEHQEQENPEAPVAQEAEEEEEEEEGADDEHPVSPLMPILQFFPTPAPLTTTTKRPTTKLYTAAIRVEPVKLPKKLTVNPKLEVKPRPITSSISEVAVTAAPAIVTSTPRKLPPPPIPYVRPASTNRGKVISSITITTTPPQVPTFPTTTTLEESMDKIEEELIAKLGARLNNQNKFSARDILSKLETLLASSDPSGAASALVAASAPASISIPSLPKQQAPSGAGSLSSASAYNSQQQQQQQQINSNSNSNINSNSNNNNAYQSMRFDPHPKTSVLDTRRFGGFGSQKLRSRVRVTGRPSSRKWRPSLSNNPSHRTTPLPQSEAEIAVQFRQSDASKTTVPPPLVPAVLMKTVPPKSTESMPTKMAHPTLHKRVSSKGTLISTRSAAAVQSSPTHAKDALEPDETYFTYDEHP
uniref:Uncharacterized protein n=1 Tax=Panagrolaimus sp. ES5 TaxID=591445 RepID=A0AC34FN88_9BILA